MDKVRIDKWLWSVRIFKTRSIAANECKSGSVKVNNKKAKPSTNLFRGDLVQVSKNGFKLVFKTIELIDKRVGAPLAAKCYSDETSDEELNKYKNWFIGKAKPEIRESGSGRPTKKERRDLEAHKSTWDYDLE